MTVMHIDPESLAGRVVKHLKDNETETLHSDGISRLFDVSPRVIHTQLGNLVAHQALRRDQDPEQGYIYRRGPQFKLVMLDGKPEPVVTALPPAAATRIPVRGVALLHEGEGIVPATQPQTAAAPAARAKALTPETVGIRKGVPMPSKQQDWGVLLGRLAEVGDSTEPMPKKLRAALGKHITTANKTEGGARFALRTIDDAHIGIWRTA